MTRGPVTVGTGALAYHALRLTEQRPSPISALPVDEGDARVRMLRPGDIARGGL